MLAQIRGIAGRGALVALLLAFLSGCGGGGGGGGPTGTSISVSPSFLAFHGSQASPAAPIAVTVRYVGDGVIVGYAPGVQPADWLSVDDSGSGGNPAVFVFYADPNTAPGAHATHIRFVTGRLDGSDIKYVDVPVTFDQSDFGVNPSALEFTAIDGSSAEPEPASQRQFTIYGSNLNWTANSDQTWLHLAQASGTNSGPVSFSLAPGSLSLGPHTAHITVNNAASGDSGQITVTLTKRSPGLRVTPNPVNFDIDAASTASALSATLQVTDELGGTDAARAVTWSMDASTLSWLSASAASGSSRPPVNVQISLDTNYLKAMPNGTYQTYLTFHYANAQTTNGLLMVPVNLNLQAPRARAAMPRLGVVGMLGSVMLHGEGFTGLQASQVLFGGTAASSITVLSDHEARAQPPANLAAGTYDVTLGSSGLNFSSAQVRVIAARTRPYAAFAVSGVPARVIFDDVRETLWVVNTGSGSLERYRYDGSQWSALSSIAVTGLRDIAFANDGKSLLITALDTLYTLDLDDAGASPFAKVSGNSGQYSFYRAAPAVDGQLVLSSQPPCCSGMFPNFHIDLPTGTAAQFPYPNWDSRGLAYGSADGSQVYLSGYDVYRYRTLDGSFTKVSDGYVMAVDRQGDRLSNQGIVYDGAFNELGRMTQYGLFPLFGPATHRGYGYRLDDYAPLGTNVVISDLAGTPVGGYYPELARVSVADDPVMGHADVFYGFGSPLALAADERTLFIRGTSKLVIVPLPAP